MLPAARATTCRTEFALLKECNEQHVKPCDEHDIKCLEDDLKEQTHWSCYRAINDGDCGKGDEVYRHSLIEQCPTPKICVMHSLEKNGYLTVPTEKTKKKGSPEGSATN